MGTQKERSRRYRVKHPERVKEACRRWREANREKAAAATRRWQWENPEKALAGQRRRRAANPAKYNELARRWREANPEKVQAIDLKRFAITLYQFNAINGAQNGLCKICGNPPYGKHKRLSVDHNHALPKGHPKRIRGLLCSACNHLLGHARDNPEILKKAIAYLTATY
jgi:hypothetical protein